MQLWKAALCDVTKGTPCFCRLPNAGRYNSGNQPIVMPERELGASFLSSSKHVEGTQCDPALCDVTMGTKRLIFVRR